MANTGDKDARIKPEYLVPKVSVEEKQVEKAKEHLLEGHQTSVEEPVIKKLKIDGETEGQEGADEAPKQESRSKANKEKKRGQNKSKNRPRPPRYFNEDKLCPHYLDGQPDTECPKQPGCQFLHDISIYLESKKQKMEEDCYMYVTYGKCTRGLTCIFATSHVDPETNKNKVNEELWAKMQPAYEYQHRNLLDKDTQIKLRKHQYDFKSVENVFSRIPTAKCNDGAAKAVDNKALQPTSGALTDEDVISLRPCEVKKIDWQDKLYLSPLTTVGNLPFRRLCVDQGADITCSEMSLATSVLQGNMHEFALHRRHSSEKIWGVQLCASNGVLAAKAAHALAECGVDYDFVDINMGCPLDTIYRQGAGSGLMCRTNKFQSLVKGMTAVLAKRDKPFTVKMRTGLRVDKNIAHSMIEFCRDNGVAAVTLHGRTREQRYLKYADWDYIGRCAKIAQPMALFGNGDVLSWEEYAQKKAASKVTGVMIGRGALIKPWIFKEIKEQRDIDLTSSERLDLIKKFVNYGLDHWGSDSQGVSTTRRFLLEFLSFFHRYIPVGILEEPPQRMNDRPPKYIGRDEMETLLSSPNAHDWVKISEIFLGPVPDNFVFAPKHKSNAWSNG